MRNNNNNFKSRGRGERSFNNKRSDNRGRNSRDDRRSDDSRGFRGERSERGFSDRRNDRGRNSRDDRRGNDSRGFRGERSERGFSDRRNDRGRNSRDDRRGNDSRSFRGKRDNGFKRNSKMRNEQKDYFNDFDKKFKDYENSAEVEEIKEDIVEEENLEVTLDDYVYGINTITELLDSDEDINKVWVEKGKRVKEINELVDRLTDAKIPVLYVDKEEINTKTNNMNNQGIMASVNPFKYVEVDDILELAKTKNEDPFILILDKVTDSQNLGAIVRSAEAAGVHGIIIPKRNSAQVTGKTAKTSAGAIFHLKVAEVSNLNNTIKDLKEKGLWIIGTEVEESNLYYESDLTGPVALVIGSEDKGVSRLVKENCDILVKIPMIGKTQSLNASVSAGILVYDIIRQRKIKKD